MIFEQVEKYQMEFKSNLSSAKVGGNKSDKEQNTIENIAKL